MPILSENWKMRPKHSWYSKLIRKYYNIRVDLTKPLCPVPDADILEKVEKEKQLVIQIPFGGLGDHLIYSSLPELLWDQKRIRTLISIKSVFRNEAIREFVWGLNPYVTFTNEKGWFIYEPLQNNLVWDEYLQKLFDLKGNGCPKVYYKPHVIEQIKGKNIVDPSFGPTGKANGYYENGFHKKFIGYLKKNVDDFILMTHKYRRTKNDLEERIKTAFNPGCYNISTIVELTDVLFSAKDRYLLHSGAASLSAVLNLKSEVINYRKPKSYLSFKYAVNNYVDLV